MGGRNKKTEAREEENEQKDQVGCTRGQDLKRQDAKKAEKTKLTTEIFSQR